MSARTTRAGGPERRNYTPPGRLRRIFFDHRGVTAVLLVGVAAGAGLFVATTAWALNERYERDVAKIAYTHDMRSLAFLAEQERRIAAEMEGRARDLDGKEAELVPSDRPYLVVSIDERKVSYVRENDTLFTAPIAVGSGKTLVMGGRTRRFVTPRGKMSITHKELNPVWVPPDWHYVEVARRHGLRVVDMSRAHPSALAGFPPGREPIRGNTIYIPPLTSPQRKHRGVLGAAKLEMYDGYYFHGTKDESTIGTAASHGCIRMRRHDILWMYENVPVGTQVYLY